jgi:hypothetical protein
VRRRRGNNKRVGEVMGEKAEQVEREESEKTDACGRAQHVVCPGVDAVGLQERCRTTANTELVQNSGKLSEGRRCCRAPPQLYVRH